MSNIAVNIAILSCKRYHDHKYLSRKRYLEEFSKVSLNRVFFENQVSSVLCFNASSSYSTLEKEIPP